MLEDDLPTPEWKNRLWKDGMGVIGEAGMLGVMSSYNDYDGFPIQSSYFWLTQKLREEMGFMGYVVSDSDAVEYLFSKHGTAQDMKEAVRQSVLAGLNVRCAFRSPDSYVIPLRELVQEGAIDMKTIDERVADILRVKFLTGLFDHPYQIDLKQADAEVNSAEHQQVALQASRESIVLLKNRDNILPLNKETIKTIAVCGPNADDASYALTHYGPLAVEVVSVLKGIQNKMGEKASVLYTKGCDLVDAHWPDSEIIDYPLTKTEQQEIDKAVAHAMKSDVAVVVLGGNARTAGENKSRSSLELPGRQLDLLKAIHATGKPVILVLINGRPLSINWVDREIPAIVEAWYPGSQGGTAIADVLFGDYNPGGKLTVTFPKTVGQIPFNFPAKPASQVDGGRTVGHKGNQSRVNGALYPFGYGLSYTSFTYSDLQFSSEDITATDSLIVSCRVKNSGEVAGDEIVQLYLHDEWVVEPGEFNIMIGSSSEDIRLKKSFYVLGEGFDKRALHTVQPATSNPQTATALHVLDRNPETFWKGERGYTLTFPLEKNKPLKGIDIRWNTLREAKPVFEIQISSGGGQFITVYKGSPEKGNDQGHYSFNESAGTDLRIRIVSGTAEISEVLF